MINLPFLSLILISGLFFAESNNLAMSDLENELQVVRFYDQGIEKGRSEDKPIFLLFTGHHCANNDKIQSLINNDNAIKDLLAKEFVNVWLFVDDPQRLPSPEIALRKDKEVTHKTFGHKWATLEINKFDRNIQPLAVIINAKGEIMNAPKTYGELKGVLEIYLSDGLNAFSGN